MGLSSTMESFAACCRVVFSGKRYPFGVVTGAVEEGAEEGPPAVLFCAILFIYVINIKYILILL
jgi:hypothetical protein